MPADPRMEAFERALTTYRHTPAGAVAAVTAARAAVVEAYREALLDARRLEKENAELRIQDAANYARWSGRSRTPRPEVPIEIWTHRETGQRYEVRRLLRPGSGQIDETKVNSRAARVEGAKTWQHYSLGYLESFAQPIDAATAPHTEASDD